jgi:hypothetical protein
MMKLGKHEEARRVFLAGCERTPCASTWEGLAGAYLKLGMYTQAEVCPQGVTRGSLRGHSEGLARAYLKLGMVTQADVRSQGVTRGSLGVTGGDRRSCFFYFFLAAFNT